MSVPAFLKELLGKRLDAGGSLHKWMALQPALPATSAPWIIFPGDPAPLPNPFALAVDGGIGEDLRVDVLKGHAHGDFHLENILIPVRPKPDASAFRLIDLSNYSEKAALARDPVHLLLSILAKDLPRMSEPTRRELADYLIRPDLVDPSHVPVGLWQSIRAIQEAGQPWITARSLMDEWDVLRPLSLVACAMMFAGRRLSERDRWWFYWLAAKSAGAYLDVVGRNHPEDARTISIPNAEQPPRAVVRSSAVAVESQPSPPRSAQRAGGQSDVGQEAELKLVQRSTVDPARPSPSDLEGLSQTQVVLLWGSMRAFSGFVARWDELNRTPRFSPSRAAVSDSFHESLQAVGEQLHRLQAIGVGHWPDGAWVTKFAYARQTAERALRELEGRASSGEPEPAEPQAAEADPQAGLRGALGALQALIRERYPSMSPDPSGQLPPGLA